MSAIRVSFTQMMMSGAIATIGVTCSSTAYGNKLISIHRLCTNRSATSVPATVAMASAVSAIPSVTRKRVGEQRAIGDERLQHDRRRRDDVGRHLVGDDESLPGREQQHGDQRRRGEAQERVRRRGRHRSWRVPCAAAIRAGFRDQRGQLLAMPREARRHAEFVAPRKRLVDRHVGDDAAGSRRPSLRRASTGTPLRRCCG